MARIELPSEMPVGRIAADWSEPLAKGAMMTGNYLERHQAWQTSPTPYETRLASALEEIFSRRVHDLTGLLAELNAAGSTGTDGRAWTEQTFATEMARLGA